MLSVAKLKLADLEKEERQMEQGADGAATGTVVYAVVEKTGHHRSVADLKKKAEPEVPAQGRA